MNKTILKFLFLIVLIPIALKSQEAQTDLGSKAYTLLNLPDLAGDKLSGQVVIAVIDDGFLLTHKATRDFYLINESEIPGNGKDDDGNGYIDDVTGWDASDLDNDVTPSDDVIADYYHGTMISSIIAKVARHSLGNQAADHIKILPVKALSDNAPNTSMHKGYAGLQYALDNNVDIICLAWSGGEIDEKYSALFQQAAGRGILILGSAGNFNTDDVRPPASIPQVHCVAALDSNLVKTPRSNYGVEVEISAPGDRVMAAHSTDDHAYFSSFGTSAAVALTTGCAALLKLVDGEAEPLEIMKAIKNTAHPVELFNPPYNGRLGAGCPDIAKALDYLLNEPARGNYFLSSRPEGDVVISKKHPQREWEFNASTSTEEIHFTLTSNRDKAGKGTLVFYDNETERYRSKIREMAPEVEISGSSARMKFEGKAPKKPVSISYQGVPVDSTTLYCNYVEITDSSGEIYDGSGDENYAHRVSCKWVVTVPAGMNIKLDFEQLDTETDVDFVYMFRGAHTLQENMFAKFSGHKRPPLIINGSNQIMLWFVTDSKVNGEGWKMKYSATNEAPGVWKR
ncbi:MAG: S8 family serine peptidase [Bacteroidetes bacterium]|nr:S8 family serine peptidase [Bacteroidota bacterium]